MAVITRSAAEVRQKLRDMVLGIAAISGTKLRESQQVFGPEYDPSGLAHGRFFWMMETEDNLGQMRDQKARHFRLAQNAVCRLSWRLRPNVKDQVGDYDTVIGTVIPKIVRAVMSQTDTDRQGMQIHYVSSDRLLIEGGKWMISLIRFRVEHMTPVDEP